MKNFRSFINSVMKRLQRTEKLLTNIQDNVYKQSKHDRQHRFRVLRQNVNTRSTS